jgi:uncharacterized integral membrane protein
MLWQLAPSNINLAHMHSSVKQPVSVSLSKLHIYFTPLPQVLHVLPVITLFNLITLRIASAEYEL